MRVSGVCYDAQGMKPCATELFDARELRSDGVLYPSRRSVPGLSGITGMAGMSGVCYDAQGMKPDATEHAGLTWVAVFLMVRRV